MAEYKGVCLDILKFCTAMVKTSITQWTLTNPNSPVLGVFRLVKKI